MQIVNKNLQFDSLVDRLATDFIVIHHSGSNYDDTESIHNYHKSLGWAGVGYTFIIEQDGTVYEGRPINKQGAHTLNYNNRALGICITGNLNTNKMTNAQSKSLNELLPYLKGIYPKAELKLHRELNNTTCPGSYFKMREGKEVSKVYDVQEAMNILVEYKVVTSPDYWHKVLDTTKYFDALILNMANALIK